MKGFVYQELRKKEREGSEGRTTTVIGIGSFPRCVRGSPTIALNRPRPRTPSLPRARQWRGAPARVKWGRPLPFPSANAFRHRCKFLIATPKIYPAERVISVCSSSPKLPHGTEGLNRPWEKKTPDRQYPPRSRVGTAD